MDAVVLSTQLLPVCRCRLDNWEHESLLVADGNQLLRLVPDAIGTRSEETVLRSREYNITSLAYDSAQTMIYFGGLPLRSRGFSEGFISRLSLLSAALNK
jgi:hypothetical protein